MYKQSKLNFIRVREISPKGRRTIRPKAPATGKKLDILINLSKPLCKKVVIKLKKMSENYVIIIKEKTKIPQANNNFNSRLVTGVL